MVSRIASEAVGVAQNLMGSGEHGRYEREGALCGGGVHQEIIMAEGWIEASSASRLELSMLGKSPLQFSSLGGRVTGTRRPSTLAKTQYLTEQDSQG